MMYNDRLDFALKNMILEKSDGVTDGESRETRKAIFDAIIDMFKHGYIMSEGGQVLYEYSMPMKDGKC